MFEREEGRGARKEERQGIRKQNKKKGENNKKKFLNYGICKFHHVNTPAMPNFCEISPAKLPFCENKQEKAYMMKHHLIRFHHGEHTQKT